jgi:hypothetical protein
MRVARTNSSDIPAPTRNRFSNYTSSEITLTGLVVSTIGTGRSTPGAKFARLKSGFQDRRLILLTRYHHKDLR